MPKDDYIRFRCSTDLKELAGKQAEEKGMNITDYMEYLIRKDGNNMMYVYNAEEMENDLREKIVNNGLAVVFNENKLLSKVEKIAIEDQVIRSDCTLEDWITYYDGGECITLIDGVSIGIDDAIDTLIGELYQPCNDDGITYADRIYNSKNPDEELQQMIKEFLLIRIDFVMTDIKYRITQIQKDIENGVFEWE